MHRILLPLLCLTALSAAETVTLRADAYPPFNNDPKSPQPGAIIEIAKACFEPAGYVVDYQNMPWTRTIDDVKAGKIDGAIGAEPAGTPGLSYPTEAQGYWQPVFITPAGSTWTYQGLDALAGVSIGIIQDYSYDVDPQGKSYGDWFAAHPQKVQVLKGENPGELALGMLGRKRLELFIEDWSVIQASAAVAKIDLATLRNAGKAGSGFPLFIGFSPNERGVKLAAILSDGTAKLRSDGKLAAILAKYGMQDWTAK